MSPFLRNEKMWLNSFQCCLDETSILISPRNQPSVRLIFIGWNQVNFLVYVEDSQKYRVGQSAKWKQYYLILRVGLYASWFWLFIKSVMFYSLFFFQKAENDRLKKPAGQIFVIFFVLFLLLKIGLVGSIDLTWFRLAKVSIVIINLINACSTSKLQLDCKFLWPQVDLNCRPLACNAGI